MSWEVQGRQHHQWFGHGTGGDDAGEAAVTRDVAGAVGAAAVAALGGARGLALAGVLAVGGAEDLAAALPIWVAASGLAAARFRAVVVGPGFGVAGAGSLQEMARELGRAGAGGVDAAGVAAAGAQLAAALGGEAVEDWGYKLNYARDMSEDAAANGLVSVGVTITAADARSVRDIDVSMARRLDDEGSTIHANANLPINSPEWSPKRQECHERCVTSSVGRGLGSDAPLVYLKCIANCMGG